MSDPPFIDGEVVWVKWGNCWWPGEVWDNSRVPADIITALRKPVIAFVKFFQEESYEFVRSPNNIMKYGCDKKLDYIKKGMDKYKTNSKVMANFPADVVKAEQLTNGNINILSNLETPTKQKTAPVVAAPEKSFTATSSISVPKKSAGAYNSSSKVQTSASPAAKSEKKFTCTLCDYTTERMNLLMFHIKNHSSTKPVQRASDSSPVVMKKASTARSPVKKALDPNDSIADDVRKIKESMKKEPKATPAKKSREPAKSTPSGRASRSAKKEEKEVVKEETVKVPEKSKPEPVNELKNELLADWMDDDDISDKPEELPPPKPAPTFEKIGESSRSIRNIPKKQRVSEVYIKAEPEKVVQPTVETKKPPTKESSKKSEDELKMPVAAKKTQKVSKRKHAAIEVADPTKLPEETDDSLFLATAELLNETEVPKVENAQLPSTFHKSNDIDKRNLPPKERNKRLLKASRESPAEANVSHSKIDNNGSMTKLADASIASPIQNELMLPHKKKQSSRLLTSDKSSPVLETRSARETKQESPSIESRTRKKRKSSEVKSADNSMEVETNSHEAPIEEKQEIQSPLREAVDVVNETNTSESAASATSNSISTHHRRGLKRRISEDSHQLTAVDPEICSEPKKLHKSDAETQAKTIIVACATETICISSKGQLSVSRRDSVVTTQANSVMVTSQVIISEATHQPIVVTTPSTDTTKPQLSVTVKLPQSVVKNALMIPPKELMEMKKQGLVTVGDDMKNKFTKKGKQIFKKITVETELEKTEKIATQPDQTSIDESAEQNVETSPEEVEPAEQDSQEIVEAPEDKSIAQVEDKEAESSLSPEVESNGALTLLVEVDESTNNNDIEKEPVAIVAVVQPSKETVEEPVEPELVENGKEAEGEEAAAEDPNNGGSGLIALQADSFGGPANCFYLCRAVDDRYEPVDNQILVLNAQNALVPYEGEDPLVPAENLAGFPQLSPNSNIIINTPNGQKIELNHFAIMALQEQADENGMASIESAGEQLELNINGIIEAITAQQEANDGENLIQGSVLIDGDGALILDTSEMPVEINHSATQVSETLSKPIMSAAVAPETMSTKTTLADSMSSKSLNIEDSLASIGVTTPAVRSNIPKCLELPITITNPTIAETVSNRKLANATLSSLDLSEVVAVEAESFVLQATDNGSQK